MIGADNKLLKLLPFLFGNARAARHGRQEAPLRSELFSADQMEHHGRTLASAHALGPQGRRDLLLARLTQNEAVLLETCDLLTTAIKAGSPITPAGEWLLDNFYLIEEQVRAARRHLPKGYSSELPRLANGPSAGLPRVYDIALEAISHGDGRVDTRKPCPIHRGVPDGDAAQPGRAVGDSDHAPPCPHREPAPGRGTHCQRQHRPQSRRFLGRQDDRDRRARSEEPGPRDCRHGALGSAHEQRVRGGARSAAAGTEPRIGAAADLGRAASGRVRPDVEATGAGGWPAPGRRPGVDRQQHRQPAASCGDRLAGVRRNGEHRRANASRGSRRRVRPYGLCHPRPLPARDREDRQALADLRSGSGAGGRTARAGRGIRALRSTSTRPMSGSTSSGTGCRSWNERSGCAGRCGTRCAAIGGRVRSGSTLARSPF